MAGIMQIVHSTAFRCMKHEDYISHIMLPLCTICSLVKTFSQARLGLTYFFLAFSSFFGPCCLPSGVGGFGMTPAWPSSLPTVVDGWAPTEIQYLQAMASIQQIQTTKTDEEWQSWNTCLILSILSPMCLLLS